MKFVWYENLLFLFTTNFTPSLKNWWKQSQIPNIELKQCEKNIVFEIWTDIRDVKETNHQI